MSTINGIAVFLETKQIEVEDINIDHSSFICGVCRGLYDHIYKIDFGGSSNIWLCLECYRELNKLIFKTRLETVKKDFIIQMRKLKTSLRKAKRMGVLK